MPEFVNFALQKFSREDRVKINDPTIQDANVVKLRATIECAIEALCRTQNIGLVFDDIMANFNGDYFWEVINSFVEKKMISKISLRNLMSGLSRLTSDNLSKLLLSLDVTQDLNQDYLIEKLVSVIATRKLWGCFFKYSLVFPRQTLRPLLSSILEEACLKVDKNTPDLDRENSSLDQTNKELLHIAGIQKLMLDPTFIPLDRTRLEMTRKSFGILQPGLRLFWFL